MSLIQASVVWKEKLHFEAQARAHRFEIDARPPQDDRGPTPKELLLAGLSGCTGMDVVAVLKSMHEELEALTVSAETETREKEPQVFQAIRVRFDVSGEKLKPASVIRAVQLSQTKYCSVSAVLAKASEISYEIFLNGERIHQGSAKFED